MMGELDYAGLRYHAQKMPDDMGIIAIAVFIVFCLTMTLVVNNLLVSKERNKDNKY